MDLRLRALGPLDPRSVPLPHETEVPSARPLDPIGAWLLEERDAPEPPSAEWSEP